MKPKEPANLPAGYDARPTPERDALDRWPFALRICDLLTKLPLEWSTRVGIHGSWGSGKTSVVQFVREIAERQGHIVVEFVPWSVQDQNELWRHFVVSLAAALKKNGISLGDSWSAKAIERFLAYQKHSRWLRHVLEHSAVSRVLVRTATDLAADFLDPKGDTIRRIQTSLGQRRILVIIDDLDRAHPSILPPLFLGMLDILNLPRFSYLLAFDDQLVGKALRASRDYFGAKHEFLEKLLDYSLQLPKFGEDQRARLIAQGLADGGLQIPIELSDPIFSLLPSNPRKIRRFTRLFVMLKDQLHRHQNEKVDWRLLIFITMIRSYSDEVLDQLVPIVTDDRYYFFDILEQDGDKRKEKRKEKISEFVSKTSLQESESREQFEKLVEQFIEYVMTRVSQSVQYYVDLWKNPDCLTWSEFTPVFERWRATGDLALIKEFVVGHAKKVQRDWRVVAQGFLQSAIGHQRTQLETAAQAYLQDEQAKAANAAVDGFLLAAKLLTNSAELFGERLFNEAETFSRLLSIHCEWAHFKTNEADKKAREAEEGELVKLGAFEWHDAVGVVAKLRPWTSQPSREDNPFPGLWNRLKGPLLEKLAAIARRSLAEGAGLRTLFDQTDRGRSFFYILGDPDSPFWQPDSIKEVKAILARAATDSAVQSNAIEFLAFIETALAHSRWPAQAERVRLVIQANQDCLSDLWLAACARPINYRMQYELLKLRLDLIEGGAREELMQIPAWLEGRWQEMKHEAKAKVSLPSNSAG